MSQTQFSASTPSACLTYENQALQAGYRLIAGLDEAGRGPLAGPVVAAAVILPADPSPLFAVKDSKQLTEQKRKKLFILIHEHARAIGLGVVDAPTIDRINILQATFLAMQKAVAALAVAPDYILVDGNQRPPWMADGAAIVRGDSLSLTISAASIIAKVTRDRIMTDYDDHYPGWGFGRHKGYGTAQHLEAIRKSGICDLHRRSFSPIASRGTDGQP